MIYTSDQQLFQKLLKIYVWLISHAYGLTFNKIGEIKVNYIVKDDNPDVDFSIDVGEVLDAEGNPIPDAQLIIEVASSDENVLQVKYDSNTKKGNAHFGAPGIAAFTVQVKSSNGTVLGSGGDNFTVTTGDPASIAGVKTAFEGLIPVPDTAAETA